MKRKKLLTLSVLLLFVLSVFSVSMTGVSAVDSPCIKVVPESTVTTDLTVGMLYTVSIYTDCTNDDIYAYQFALNYNPNILEGFEVTNGDLIVGGSAQLYVGPFDNTVGELSKTVGIFYNEGEVTSGPGILANVTFRVVGIGPSDITIGPETKLKGWDDWEEEDYDIIYAVDDPTHIQHGYFDNTGAQAYPPYPPVAVITASRQYVNESITFSGASSYDPDGTSIISYRWDFGDGTPPMSTTDPTIDHTYTIFGIYTVTLIVTDEQNQVGDPSYFSANVKERVPYTANLVKWKVKPEANQWDYSKDEDKRVTIIALARNSGSKPVNVSVTFVIIDAASGMPAGDDIVVNVTLEYDPYVDVKIYSDPFDPYEYGYEDTKIVLFVHTTLTYDSNGDGIPDTDTETKIKRFTIVP